MGLFEKIYKMCKEDDIELFKTLDLNDLNDFHIFSITTNAINIKSSKIINNIIDENKFIISIESLIKYYMDLEDENIGNYIIKNIKNYDEISDINFSLLKNDTDIYKLIFLSKIYNKLDRYVDFVKNCKKNNIEYKKWINK